MSLGLDLGGIAGVAGGMWANAKNLEFAEEMASTQYQRAVADMKAAGLNPMAIFGSGGGSPAAAPSGQVENPVPQGIGATAQNMIGIAESIASARKTGAEAEAAESAAKLAASEAEIRTKENSAYSSALDSDLGKKSAVAQKYGSGPLEWLTGAGAALGMTGEDQGWGGDSSAWSTAPARWARRQQEAHDQRQFEAWYNRRFNPAKSGWQLLREEEQRKKDVKERVEKGATGTPSFGGGRSPAKWWN